MPPPGAVGVVAMYMQMHVAWWVWEKLLKMKVKKLVKKLKKSKTMQLKNLKKTKLTKSKTTLTIKVKLKI